MIFLSGCKVYTCCNQLINNLLRDFKQTDYNSYTSKPIMKSNLILLVFCFLIENKHDDIMPDYYIRLKDQMNQLKSVLFNRLIIQQLTNSKGYGIMDNDIYRPGFHYLQMLILNLLICLMK